MPNDAEGFTQQVKKYTGCRVRSRDKAGGGQGGAVGDAADSAEAITGSDNGDAG